MISSSKKICVMFFCVSSAEDIPKYYLVLKSGGLNMQWWLDTHIWRIYNSLLFRFWHSFVLLKLASAIISVLMKSDKYNPLLNVDKRCRQIRLVWHSLLVHLLIFLKLSGEQFFVFGDLLCNIWLGFLCVYFFCSGANTMYLDCYCD